MESDACDIEAAHAYDRVGTTNGVIAEAVAVAAAELAAIQPQRKDGVATFGLPCGRE